MAEHSPENRRSSSESSVEVSPAVDGRKSLELENAEATGAGVVAPVVNGAGSSTGSLSFSYGCGFGGIRSRIIRGCVIRK